MSPAEDASTWELSNITIPDSLEDAPRINHFGEHWQERIAEAPDEVFHAGIVSREGEEVMEVSPPDGENVSSDSSEESDSDEGTPRCRHSDSISQVEEEGAGREELAEDPAEELKEEPAEELTKGPAEGPTEETAVEYPTLG